MVLDWNTLLGAAIGALLVFLFTEVREYRQRRRERAGLLKLLLAEIDHNQKSLTELDKSATGPDFHRLGGKAVPVTLEAWIECRAKIAQLVDLKVFGDFEDYYRICQGLKDIRPPSSQPHRLTERPTEFAIKEEALQNQATVASDGMKSTSACLLATFGPGCKACRRLTARGRKWSEVCNESIPMQC